MRRRVAIKVLPPGRVDDSSYLARFRREAEAVAHLDHPNIVRAFDIDHEVKTNSHYFVMEYIDGLDFLQIVKGEGPLEYRRAAEYIVHIGLVMHAANLPACRRGRLAEFQQVFQPFFHQPVTDGLETQRAFGVLPSHVVQRAVRMGDESEHSWFSSR